MAALIDAWGERGRIVAEPEAAALLGPGRWETAANDVPPASFADVGVAIVPARIGVAESGAVAVERARAPHRALHFLCQRLVLLLPRSAIVPDLHTAFARLTESGGSPGDVTWVSGPSKTADIEQALNLPEGVNLVGVRWDADYRRVFLDLCGALPERYEIEIGEAVRRVNGRDVAEVRGLRQYFDREEKKDE